MKHLHYYIGVLFIKEIPVAWICRHCLNALNQIKMNEFFRENWK